MPAHWSRPYSVRDDDAASVFDAERFETNIFDIAGDADRRDHASTLGSGSCRPCVFERSGDAVGALLDLHDLGAGEDLHALLRERFVRRRPAISASSTGRMRGSTSTTVTSAPRRDRRRRTRSRSRPSPQPAGFRDGIGHHRLEIGPDQLAVGLQPRQDPRPGPRRDHDVLGLIGAFAENALGRPSWAGRRLRQLAP